MTTDPKIVDRVAAMLEKRGWARGTSARDRARKLLEDLDVAGLQITRKGEAP